MSIQRAETVQAQFTAAPEDREETRQVALARTGDRGAIDWLLERYRSRAVRLATHILRHSGDAEDAAQEAFVRAFRNLHAYREESRFYTWLYRIVVRVCMDYRRRAWWSAETQMTEAAEPTQTDPGIAGADSRMIVEALLDRLSPPLRATLVLRELEGLAYAEIARVMEVPIGRVKWRLNRARTLFAALVETARKEYEHV